MQGPQHCQCSLEIRLEEAAAARQCVARSENFSSDESADMRPSEDDDLRMVSLW